jgi:hypothetical protein
MAQRLVTSEPAHAQAGLQAAVIRWRLQQAHERAERRRARLAHWLDGVDAATFARNGFVLKRQVLPPAEFEALREQAQALRAPAHEMLLGDTVTRHLQLDERLLRSAPALATLLHGALWNGLTRYVAASRHAPPAFVQTLVTHTRPTERDPQTLLHSDAPVPTMKAWFFLNDVGDDDAPLCYVPGSHRLTPQRLAWEVAQHLLPAEAVTRTLGVALPRRIDKLSLAELGLGHPARLVVPANTLIVADTFGFHKRAHARHPTMRVELWAGSAQPAGHRGWAGGLGEHLGARPSAWRARGPMQALLLPHWAPQDPACTDARQGVY